MKHKKLFIIALFLLGACQSETNNQDMRTTLLQEGRMRSQIVIDGETIPLPDKYFELDFVGRFITSAAKKSLQEQQSPDVFLNKLGDELYTKPGFSLDESYTYSFVPFRKVTYKVYVPLSKNNMGEDYTECYLIGQPENVLYKEMLSPDSLTGNYLMLCPDVEGGRLPDYSEGLPVAGLHNFQPFFGIITEGDVDRHTAPFYIPVNDEIERIVTTQTTLSYEQVEKAMSGISRVQIVGILDPKVLNIE